jgi:hypothetical protein
MRLAKLFSDGIVSNGKTLMSELHVTKPVISAFNSILT